jgi:mono/diheme cytochrome c family protein
MIALGTIRCNAAESATTTTVSRGRHSLPYTRRQLRHFNGGPLGALSSVRRRWPMIEYRGNAIADCWEMRGSVIVSDVDEDAANAKALLNGVAMVQWRKLREAVSVCVLIVGFPARGNAGDQAVRRFQRDVQPILEQHCFACHAAGTAKGRVSFDTFADDAAKLDPELWLRVLKNVRAGIMPPAGEDRLSAKEIATLENWIKSEAFRIDPGDPDPGHVTLRRLNRQEYRYTIQDLLGYEYDTDENFPADDTGHGFDNIGSLLNTSPLLVEKYLRSANEIVRAAVPSATKVVREQTIRATDFIDPKGDKDRVSCQKPGRYATTIQIMEQGTYGVRIKFQVFGGGFPTDAKTNVSLHCGGEEVHSQAYAWQQEERGHLAIVNFSRQWPRGEVELAFTVDPLVGNGPKPKPVPLTLHIISVRLDGPFDETQWVTPPNYARFFPRPAPPEGKAERREYARDVLRPFVGRAFRRPVDEPALDRLVDLAEATYSVPGATFEQGIQQAMIATISSRRFLFRLEQPIADKSKSRFPLIDEYSLASRLSYLLWCSMPDDELLALAKRGALRHNLAAQVTRMLGDPKCSRFVESFVGQWLRTREVDSVEIDPRLVLARDNNVEADELAYREELNQAFLDRRKKEEELFLKGEKIANDADPQTSILASMKHKPPQLPNVNLDKSLRSAMRGETEACFAYVLREDRSLLEMIDSDYTFLNERLAKHYGIPGVVGPKMRKVTLPADSSRGGILAHAGLLLITSQSTRTSAVKRGVFVLDNLLGTPPPPPPPDIPLLEDAKDAVPGGKATLREMLERHRQNKLCASCHRRMDPIGFALENFNALGMWRTKEGGQKIDITGELLTGEKLEGVNDLRKVLVEGRRTDYYRCLTEKMMIYALGRGLGYADTAAIDQIVERVEKEKGRSLSLLMGVIESAPFQKCRAADIQTSVPHRDANIKNIVR